MWNENTLLDYLHFRSPSTAIISFTLISLIPFATKLKKLKTKIDINRLISIMRPYAKAA